MVIIKQVKECDFNGTKYEPAVTGAACIAQGASGRWCEVMHAGPEYVEENNWTPLSYEEAVRIIEEERTGWVDF